MVLSFLLHGAAESWALSKTQLSRLETLHTPTHMHAHVPGLMRPTHPPTHACMPISVMIKERRLRWLGNTVRRSDNNMVKELLFAMRIPGHLQPVGRPCGTWMHYVLRDVKDMDSKWVTAA